MTGTIVGPFFGEITNHLWQSTIFALAAALLTLACRRNRARVRYGLWLGASLKFLIPFALLMTLGSNIREALTARSIVAGFAAPAVSLKMMQIAQPFPGAPFPPAAPHAAHWLPVAIFAVWACGFAAIVLIRLRGWLRVRAAVRAGTLMDIGAPVEVRSSPSLLEPGVVGLFRSTLLLPQGIQQTLTPSQLEAVVAHELSHVRHHDNLTAALHMLVEAVFWFYPPIWWIGARLVHERERACDEAVLSLGAKPGDYAEAILKVCKLYVESPLICVSGVTGPSLNRRMHAILTQGLSAKLPYGKRITLVIIGFAALAAPLALGMLTAPLAHARPSRSAGIDLQPAPGANRNRRSPYLVSLGTVTANTVVVTPRLDGQLIAVKFKEGTLVQKGQLLALIDSKPYRLQLAAAQGLLARDQAKVETAKRQLSYAEVTAPITGIVGFRLVDVGNIVHPTDRLVVINQLQPIAVLFNLPQEYLPAILPRLEAGANPTVELLNRDGATKTLAIGRLVAADNQIDTTTGTVTLKAVFENKDGALFPGQFVNVRLLVKCAATGAVDPFCR